jgi:hypothetical protein
VAVVAVQVILAVLAAAVLVAGITVEMALQTQVVGAVEPTLAVQQVQVVQVLSSYVIQTHSEPQQAQQVHQLLL